MDTLEKYTNKGIEEYFKREEIEKPKDIIKYEGFINSMMQHFYKYIWSIYTDDDFDINKLNDTPRPKDNMYEKLKGNKLANRLCDMIYHSVIASFGLSQLFGIVLSSDIEEISVEIYDLTGNRAPLKDYTPKTKVIQQGNGLCYFLCV